MAGGGPLGRAGWLAYHGGQTLHGVHDIRARCRPFPTCSPLTITITITITLTLALTSHPHPHPHPPPFILTLTLHPHPHPGEAIWSPRLYEYSTMIAPEGYEGTFVAVAFVPQYVSAGVVGVTSGYLLDRYVPEELEPGEERQPCASHTPQL